MKNYNYLALQGWEVDDMEIVSEWGLDPYVAFTPAINDAYLDALYKVTLENYMSLDSSEEYATQKAYEIYQETKCMIDALKED
jgi:ketopantoate hydroxymethyltransferase